MIQKICKTQPSPSFFSISSIADHSEKLRKRNVRANRRRIGRNPSTIEGGHGSINYLTKLFSSALIPPPLILAHPPLRATTTLFSPQATSVCVSLRPSADLRVNRSSSSISSIFRQITASETRNGES